MAMPKAMSATALSISSRSSMPLAGGGDGTVALNDARAALNIRPPNELGTPRPYRNPVCRTVR